MAKGAKNGEKNNIWHKRKRCWISLNKWIILITIGFIVVCLIFIYVGLDAAYLNFVGPLYIGLIAFFQDINFKKEEIERHKRSIQPILSVRIINKNNDGERNKILFERDIIHYTLSVIEIKNVGKYPGLNLSVLFMDEKNNELFSEEKDKIDFDVLEPNEKKRFVFVYPREVLSKEHPLNETLNIQDDNIIFALDEFQYKLTKGCLPKQLSICYYDKDGNSERQKFELKEPFGSSMYYSLKEHSVYDREGR